MRVAGEVGLAARRAAATLLAGSLLAALLVPLQAAPASAAEVPVSVFNQPNLNGSGTACDVENSNLLSIIDVLDGYSVDGTIVDFGESFAGLLEDSYFFFMTDMENADPADSTFLPEASREALADWTDRGGVMVMTGTAGGHDAKFLNLVYGWDLTTTASTSWTRDAANVAATPFAEVDAPTLPAPSATDSIGGGTVPGFTPMWGTADDATTAVIPYGEGTVIFLGFDFYNTGADGSLTSYRDGPVCPAHTNVWVQEVLPAALQYASELSVSEVADVTDTSATVSYGFSESGTAHYVVVPEGSATPSPEEVVAGGAYGGVTPIAAGSAVIDGDAEQVFALAGLTAMTAYDVYIVTSYDDEGIPTLSAVELVELTTMASAPAVSVVRGDGRVTVSATIAVEVGVTNYQYSLDGGVTWQTRTPASTVSPWVIEGLENGTTYQVSVRAVMGPDTGLPSDIVAVTPAERRKSSDRSPPAAPPVDPKPEPVRTEQDALPPTGTGQAMVGGERASVIVTPTPSGGVAAGNEDFSIQVDVDGALPPAEGILSPDTVVEFVRGRQATVTVQGFAPRSELKVWLFSQPVLLGTFETDGGGELEAVTDAIGDETSACQHTLHAHGRLADGRVVEVSLGVWVDSDSFPFGDVDPTNAHRRAIGCLADLGVVAGTNAVTFTPGADVTRGQAASLLARLLDLAPSDAPLPADVVGTTHADSVGAVLAAGLARGDADGAFRPNDPVTRGQLASLVRAVLDLDVTESSPFRDGGDTHGDALAALAVAELLTGFDDGTARPNVPVTRGQTASVLSRALPMLGE